MSRLFDPQMGQVNQAPISSVPQEAQPLIPEALHQDPKIAKAKELEKTLQDFGGVVQNFSVFEVIMSALGVIATKADADWVAYFGESISEYIENSFLGEKGPPTLAQAPLRALAKLFGIKNESGEHLQTADDLMGSKEKVIGAINVSMSYVAVADTLFQTVKNILHRGHPPSKHGPLKLAFKYTSDFVLPIINTVLMWSSSVGKKHIANAIQELAPNDHNREDVNGAMTSGNQDWLCGINSGLLAVRKFIEKFVSHDLGKILEPIFALYMSMASYKEGQKALNGIEDDDTGVKYELAGRDKSSFGRDLYGFVREISRIFNVALPELSSLKS